VYVLNVSPISNVCCSKCFMLQVFTLAAMGNESRRWRSRVHAQKHEVRRQASMHMQACAAGACRVLENLVLIAGVHDNDRLQLPCFGDHALLETRAMRVCFRLKNCAHAFACSNNMRNRQGSMRRRASTAGACGHVQQQGAGGSSASGRAARESRRGLASGCSGTSHAV
jgi:hypothetical protein